MAGLTNIHAPSTEPSGKLRINCLARVVLPHGLGPRATTTGNNSSISVIFLISVFLLINKQPTLYIEMSDIYSEFSMKM